MSRHYYSDPLDQFLIKSEHEIFGEIAKNDPFSSDDLQKIAWSEQIRILKNQFNELQNGHILFEYTIPRIGSRVDVIFLYHGIVFVLEFKVGASDFNRRDIEQVTDYALDLSDFHKESHSKRLVPILLCTRAEVVNFTIGELKDNVLQPLLCDTAHLGECIKLVCDKYREAAFDIETWIHSLYMPTPTIIEAAQVLYRGHTVEDISRNDANAKNLNQTTHEINEIIDWSKKHQRKSICFVTGVPGAGKTLAGLNIAINRQNIDEDEHAVFLSGNGPLVDVLQEALARDEAKRTGGSKKEALRKSKEFVQLIHHFRDDAIAVSQPPIEKVVIFDEAQRAWDRENLTRFMARKKGKANFDQSEPEFLISILDRHTDWATIVCLIGGGQEINTGEAGLLEWFDSLAGKFPHWDVYLSDQITDSEYIRDVDFNDIVARLNAGIKSDLHLSVSLRSFRSENVSNLVKALLDVDTKAAKGLLPLIKAQYPIILTRHLDTAMDWVRRQAKGSQRYGLIASSGAKRLRTHGVWVQNKVDAPMWFLNDRDDVRSSYYLEEVATEFDIQGLELDYTIVCWDANLRYKKGSFESYQFIGTKWQNIHQAEKILYLKNTYRVLLTRARQGFVIFIPEGDEHDATRKPEFYDGVYHYLKDLGIEEI